jgi:hypothetical protein
VFYIYCYISFALRNQWNNGEETERKKKNVAVADAWGIRDWKSYNSITMTAFAAGQGGEK